MKLQIIILAAGCGKRMLSKTPKVLHKLAGKALLAHVVDTAQKLNPDDIFIVYGYGGEAVRQSLPNHNVHWVLQEQQLGTGHAVMQVFPYLDKNAKVLLLSADVPLIQVQTLRAFLAITKEYANPDYLGLLLANLDNPTGLGRIIRNKNNEICAIVEEKDATKDQKLIKEVYTGICCTNAASLMQWLANCTNSNAQQEYYLTELVKNAANEQCRILSFYVQEDFEVSGVNNRWQLHQLERIWQHHNAKQLISSGVSIADANRFDLRGDLNCGDGVSIDVNVVLNGRVTLGSGCNIGPNCILTNVTMGTNCNIFANSILENCVLGNNCNIGPFARLRPNTQLADNCKIGNFVETKNIIVGDNSKANHLSYLGDAKVGSNVNIGAGTITCNYDGANKHETIIADGAFIGSGTQLVAPVTIGVNATIGAGSTIRKNAKDNELTLTESKQQTILGWQRPTKKK